MQFVTHRYFQGELLIPNIKPVSSTELVIPVITSQRELLDMFVDKYEKKFLTDFLGKDLCKRFYDAFWNLVGAAPPEWEALKNHLYNTDLWLSPIANYIYYWFQRNSATSTSGVGEVRTIAENAVIESPSYKMTRAWNEMVDMLIHEIEPWILENNVYGYRHRDSDIWHKINVLNI